MEEMEGPHARYFPVSGPTRTGHSSCGGCGQPGTVKHVLQGPGWGEGGLPSVAFVLGERAASEALPHGSKTGQVLSSARLHRGPCCCFSHL